MSATGYLDACGFIPASSGTGNFVVSTNVTGYQTPASAGAVNSTIYSYRAESADKSQWEEGYGAYTVSTTTLARTTITANSSGGTSAINFSAAPNVFIVAASADLQNASLLTSGTLPAARIAFAAKSDQTTGTSTTLPVTPSVQQNHASAGKAWVNFLASSTSGNQTVNDSFNVSSVSRTATGTYTINFTTSFANATYACVGALLDTTNHAAITTNFKSMTTASVVVLFYNVSAALIDPSGNVSFLAFGSQ